jgi:hypothetical protein
MVSGWVGLHVGVHVGCSSLANRSLSSQTWGICTGSGMRGCASFACCVYDGGAKLQVMGSQLRSGTDGMQSCHAMQKSRALYSWCCWCSRTAGVHRCRRVRLRWWLLSRLPGWAFQAGAGRVCCSVWPTSASCAAVVIKCPVVQPLCVPAIHARLLLLLRMSQGSCSLGCIAGLSQMAASCHANLQLGLQPSHGPLLMPLHSRYPAIA